MKPSDAKRQSGANRDVDPAFIEQRLRDMAEGLTEAIGREVDRRRREGLLIHVSYNGKVIDLQKTGTPPAG